MVEHFLGKEEVESPILFNGSLEKIKSEKVFIFVELTIFLTIFENVFVSLVIIVKKSFKFTFHKIN